MQKRNFQQQATREGFGSVKLSEAQTGYIRGHSKPGPEKTKAGPPPPPIPQQPKK